MSASESLRRAGVLDRELTQYVNTGSHPERLTDIEEIPQSGQLAPSRGSNGALLE
jgi:hypothetical protein